MCIFSLCELGNSNSINDGANVTSVSKSNNEKAQQKDLKYKPKIERQFEQEANNSFAFVADGRVR